MIVLFALNPVGCFLDWSIRKKVKLFFFVHHPFLSFLISVQSLKLDANKFKVLWWRRVILVSMPVLSVIPI